MNEDDFTRDIIKPLFESMGYDKVDFNGGAYERGRDLIAQRRIPPKKENYVVYVQSKKVGDIQNTSKAAKLSTLLHQLRQCCLGKLTDAEGNKVLPNEVYLACPEPISDRLIEEIKDQLFGMPLKVYPYDGPKIIQDIKEYKPELLSILSNIEDKITAHQILAPSNKELLAALKSTTNQKIDDFYSDLSFFVGSFDSNLLMHLDILSIQKDIEIHEDNWANFKKDIEKISSKHSLYFLTNEISVIEKSFKSNKQDFESSENKVLIEQKDHLLIKSADLNSRIKSFIKSLKESLKPESNPLIKTMKPEEVNNREKILDEVIFYIQSNSTRIKRKSVKNSTFYDEVDLVYSLSDELNKTEKKLNLLQGKVKLSPAYKVSIYVDTLKSRILKDKEDYIRDIQLINNRELGITKLKNFLTKTEKTLSLISMLKDKDNQLSYLVSFKHNDSAQDRVTISPHDIFSTGHDIAVYGGAGVGKTTTLKAYSDVLAEHEPKNVIYIPLNRLVDEYKNFSNKEENLEGLKKNLLIKIILLSKGITPTSENIDDAKSILINKFVIILDGLDEVYNAIPDIISAISKFKSERPLSQLIISSRDCVSYLDDIDFLGITLLPFTKEQLHKFIRGWFQDKLDEAQHLIDAIENKGLYEYIKTPLLATITCSLVQKGVDAPSSENEIYSERLNLLTGEYDLHKNIERQKQKGELLRRCAMKIAFKMHNNGVRSEYKDNMLNVLRHDLVDKYSEQLLHDCLNELINPCNVLIQDPITKKYSFGHFRFQEHLASQELSLNRSIELSELVTIDWWRGALCLYAQDNDISYLFEDVYKRYGNIHRAIITFTAMIASRPKSNQRDLQILFREYEKSDELDDVYASSSYDNDYGYDRDYCS